MPGKPGKIIAALCAPGKAEAQTIRAQHGAIVIRNDTRNHEYRFAAAKANALFHPKQTALPRQ